MTEVLHSDFSLTDITSTRLLSKVNVQVISSNQITIFEPQIQYPANTSKNSNMNQGKFMFVREYYTCILKC